MVCRGLFSLGLKCVVCFVAGVLVLSGLVGCGGAGGPRHVVGAVNGVRPQPLELPEYPEDLGVEDTAENAIRAAEYFLELMNYTQSSGDTGAYEAVSAAGCTSCHGFIDRVEELYSSGGFLIGTSASLGSLHAQRTVDGLAWEVTVDITLAKGFRYKPDQNPSHEYLSGKVLPGMRVGVCLCDGEWEMLIMAEGGPR